MREAWFVMYQFLKPMNRIHQIDEEIERREKEREELQKENEQDHAAAMAIFRANPGVDSVIIGDTVLYFDGTSILILTPQYASGLKMPEPPPGPNGDEIADQILTEAFHLPCSPDLDVDELAKQYA